MSLMVRFVRTSDQSHYFSFDICGFKATLTLFSAFQFPTKYDDFNENRALTCVMWIYFSRLGGTDAETRINVSVQRKDVKIKIMGNYMRMRVER